MSKDMVPTGTDKEKDMSTIDRAKQMIESSLREAVLIATDGTASMGFGTELGDQIGEETSILSRALDKAGLLAPDPPEPDDVEPERAVTEVIRLRRAITDLRDDYLEHIADYDESTVTHMCYGTAADDLDRILNGDTP